LLEWIQEASYLPDPEELHLAAATALIDAAEARYLADPELDYSPVFNETNDPDGSLSAAYLRNSQRSAAKRDTTALASK
jgi:hypothetical protein